MRFLLSTVISAALLTAQAASAQSCARPPEKAAFNVAGLKSQLMVIAITCRAEQRYNAFVIRFRSDLIGADRALTGYFSRRFGRGAQAAHDDYITSLANAQSQIGIRSGTAFCQQTLPLFDVAMTVGGGFDLAPLAATLTLAQPIDLVECASPKQARTRTAALEPRTRQR